MHSPLVAPSACTTCDHYGHPPVHQFSPCKLSRCFEIFIFSITCSSPFSPWERRRRKRIAFSAPEALRLSVHLTGQSRPSTASKYVFQHYFSLYPSEPILYALGEKKVSLFGPHGHCPSDVVSCGLRPISNDNLSRLLGLLGGLRSVPTLSWQSRIISSVPIVFSRSWGGALTASNWRRKRTIRMTA